jgi:hypothetical protein
MPMMIESNENESQDARKVEISHNTEKSDDDEHEGKNEMEQVGENVYVDKFLSCRILRSFRIVGQGVMIRSTVGRSLNRGFIGRGNHNL